MSWHGYGLAVDVISESKGWGAGAEWFANVASVFKKFDCAWGGEWVDADLPHFQWGRCKPSPSALAREIIVSQGVRGVWIAVGADKGEKDSEIEGLNLNPLAKQAASILAARFPSTRFTSGRRTLDEQAAAMAQNISADRNYVKQTYKESDIAKACQGWVDKHPNVVTVPEITQGLLEELGKFSPDQTSKLSRHLSGDAFDVQPVLVGAEAIVAFIRSLPNLELFLTKEGKLDRWHAQFRASSPP